MVGVFKHYFVQVQCPKNIRRVVRYGILGSLFLMYFIPKNSTGEIQLSFQSTSDLLGSELLPQILSITFYMQKSRGFRGVEESCLLLYV